MEKKLFEVIAKTINVSASEVSMKLAQGDVEKWDSLGHFELIIAVENAFGVKFKSTDIGELTDVNRIARKLKELL
jgi:acyl carrier protein